jgi:hypothetical protein
MAHQQVILELPSRNGVLVEMRFLGVGGHSSEEYVKQAIANVEAELQANDRRLCGCFSTPMTSNYRPELDYTPFLTDEATTYYMELIGILRWIVE